MQIYKITNIINNKIYIGLDSKNRSDYYGSGVLIKKAINKYGVENFTKEILQECQTKDDLCKAEIFWIKHYNSTDKNIGYNITPGGEFGDAFTNNPNKELIREKLRIINTGKKLSNEHRTKISNGLLKSEKFQLAVKSEERKKKLSIANIGENHPMFGKKYSKEICKKMGDSHIGNKNAVGHIVSEDLKNKISAKLTGIKRSEETKEKMRKPKSEEHCKNISVGNTGRKHSEETKEKIRLSLLGRKRTNIK